MDKLYTIVRSDIPTGAQVAQTAHALAAYASAHRERFKAWAEPEQRNIVCLVVPGRAELEALLATLRWANVTCAAFRETDLDNELTGIACGEEGARLLSSLPLAGRVAKQAA